MGLCGCSDDGGDPPATDTQTADTSAPEDIAAPPVDTTVTPEDTPPHPDDAAVDTPGPPEDVTADTNPPPPDVVEDTTPDNPCPNGNGGYCGSRFPTEDVKPYYLYDCNDGVLTLLEDCEFPCQEVDPPFVDYCTIDPDDPCPFNDGLYCGENVGLVKDTLFDCKGGVYTPVEVCALGCESTNFQGFDLCIKEE